MKRTRTDDASIEQRVREILNPAFDEWINRKIDSAELDRRRELAHKQATAEHSGSPTAVASWATAAAETGAKSAAEATGSKGVGLPKRPSESSCHLASNSLSTWQTDPDSHPVWPPSRTKKTIKNPMAQNFPGMNFLNANEIVEGSILRNDSKAATRNRALAEGCVRANATELIWWEPTAVQAAMVTCGGLCPGLNSIIKGITNCLWYDYGVGRNGGKIWGVTAGYNGLSEPDEHEWVPLEPKKVREIHMKGGSILKAGRGGFDAKKIVETLRAKGINMVRSPEPEPEP